MLSGQSVHKGVSEFDPVKEAGLIADSEISVIGFYNEKFCPLSGKILQRLGELAEARKEMLVRKSEYWGILEEGPDDFGSANYVKCVPSLLIVEKGRSYAINDVYRSVFSRKDFLDRLSQEMELIRDGKRDGYTLRLAATYA